MSKFAIILGANGGIGAPITDAVLAAGYTVLGTEPSEESHKRAGGERGEQFIPCILDLDDDQSVESFMTKATERPIDLFINVAGFIDEKEPALNVPLSVVHKTFKVNVATVAWMTEALLHHFSPTAQVIHISSTAGLWGNPGFPIYSASKAGLNTFCRSIAKLFLSTEKRIYCICPGPTNTGLRQRIAGDADKHQDPVCIANTIRSIITGASSFKNGDIIIVRDGKESLHQALD